MYLLIHVCKPYECITINNMPVISIPCHYIQPVGHADHFMFIIFFFLIKVNVTLNLSNFNH